ncbi:DUF4407 domain-containing protein [Nocardia sp. NPDC003345]
MSVTGVFIWLGGGQPAEAADGYERTGYTLTGVAVALFALVTGGITATALASGDWPAPAVVLTALVAGVLAGLVGRALAGAEPTARPDRKAGAPNTPAVLLRVGVALAAGLLVAELATTVLFAGSVDRVLDERAAADATAAPAVRTAQDDLDNAIAERTALDGTIARAGTDIDTALTIARCEFNPTPECPQTKITGVPGRGPEAGTANDMLDDARAALTAAQNRVAPLDQRVTDARAALREARATAAGRDDRGFGARWSAAHDHTTAHTGAFVIRALTWLFFALLALLPLILRWWRGETTQERRRAAEAVRDRADRAADAAVAEQEARVRAETAAVRAEQRLTSARLAAEADTTIDRERQRTRVIAALGGLEIGVTEREGVTGAAEPGPRALPAGGRELERVDHADVPATTAAHKRPAGLELPFIGALPFSDTAARMIRPLVPSFVGTAIDNALDTAGRPLRTARQVLTEAEEITFTLRRTRKISVEGPGGDREPDRSASPPAPRHDDDVIDADFTLESDAIVSATTRLEPGRNPLPQAHPRELPPADR